MLEADAERRHQPHPGDDDPPHREVHPEPTAHAAKRVVNGAHAARSSALHVQLCASMKLTASLTVTIFSAASSGNFAPELLLERHDQLDGVEAVGAQIVDKAGIFGHLGFVDAEMLDDDLLDPLGDVAHALISLIDAADWLDSAWSRRPVRGFCRSMSAAADQ